MSSSAFDRVASSFARQGMMQHLGARLLRVQAAEVEFSLPMSERVTQQQGAFHGGAIAALADIACGYAALTTAPEGLEVTSVEFKINFMSAAVGQEIICIGRVLKSGRSLSVCSAEVFDLQGEQRKLCGLMQATMFHVAKQY